MRANWCLLWPSPWPVGKGQAFAKPISVVVEAELAQNHHYIFLLSLSGKIPKDSLHGQLSTIIAKVGLLGFRHVGKTAVWPTSVVGGRKVKAEALLCHFVDVDGGYEVCLDAEFREPVRELRHPFLHQVLPLLLHSVVDFIRIRRRLLAGGSDAFALKVTNQQQYKLQSVDHTYQLVFFHRTKYR